MLNPDPKKLRFLGIDLRSRFRRRCAVVLTFAVFFVAMLSLSVEVDESKLLHGHFVGLVLMFVVAFMCSLGIFRENGPVKAFNEPVWRLNGFKGGSVLLRSLDDLAEYRFGGKFDVLPEAQQNEVLRTYRVGNYFYPAASSNSPSRLDERERIEKDRAYSATLASLTRYLFIMAGVFSTRRSGIDPNEIVAFLITFGFIGQNGPKATILWNEPTPLSDGELRIVDDRGREVS